MITERKIGIVMLIFGLVLVTDSVMYYFYNVGNIPFIFLIPNNFKSWKYFWEK